MNFVVVDSSVAFKWLAQVGEASVEEAFTLLAGHQSGDIVLVAPATLYVELASAVRNYRHLSEEETVSVISELGALQIRLMEPTTSRLASSARLSYRHSISVYDALFLALATELDCPLVTADRRAFEGIATGVEIHLL